MPTLRGYLTTATGAALWGAGRAFGAGPLEQVGFALVVLVVLAILLVNRRRDDLSVTRRISPERALAGQPVEVELVLSNNGRGPAPLMLLDDRVPLELAGSARFAVGGIEVGGTRSARYWVQPPRRGRYIIGPLQVAYIDPFGLATNRSGVAAGSELLVRPRIEKLSLPRDLGGRRSTSVSAIRQLSGARGEDFFTLREYAEGDDLRKIHWASTARRGRAMIRQEETPWHTRAVILIDDSAAAHDGYGESSSFERAVEAAAAIADLYHRSGYTYSLLGSHARGVPAGRGTDHYNRCLDLLTDLQVVASPGQDDALLVRLAGLQSGTDGEGTLVVVPGTISAEAAVGISGCERRFRQVIVVGFPAHRFGAGPTATRWEGEQQSLEVVSLLARSGARAFVLGPDEPLGPAWSSLRPGMRGGGEWAPKLERA
jgi:uncharacterized protein (DUF58 family)